MKTRPVATTIEPEETRDGAGVRLRRTIASRALDYLDPFLLLDHFGSENPEDYAAGFPLHPHRGIETVTYMLDGSVKHRDSTGREGVIGAGDVQWMSAGRAILHEEMPQVSPTGNFGFQLWVNLPKSQKMMKPRYQEFRAPEIPEVMHEGSRIKIVAGEVDGVKGAVTDIAAQPNYLDVHMPAGKRFTHPVRSGHAAFAYLYEGDASFGAEDVRVHGPRLVVFGDGDSITAASLGGPARFLLVSGAPIGEPVARWGPFVMNTREEIAETLEELRDGRFVDMANERDARMAFQVRLVQPSDSAAVARIYAPAVIGRATSFEYEPPDAAEMARRIAKTLPALPWLVATREGAVIGYAYAGRHKERDAYAWSVDVSVYVDSDVHRAGIGRGLYTALFAILALQGYRNAFAGATLPNAGSVGLHTAMGFQPVGVYEGVGYKLGRWHDVAWFARPLSPRGPEPSVPLSIDAVERLPEFAAALKAGAACMKEGD